MALSVEPLPNVRFYASYDRGYKAGAFVGGYIGTLLGFGSVSGFDLRSLLIAIAGAALLLFLYRRLAR